MTREQITRAIETVTLTREEREMLDVAMEEAGAQAVRTMFASVDSAARMLKYACYIQVTDKWLTMPRPAALELSRLATETTARLDLHQHMNTYMARLSSKLQLMDTPHD